MKVLIYHPTSNQNNRAVINGLYAADMLHKFYTSIATFPGGILHTLGTIKLFAEIKRRGFDPKIERFTTDFPSKEIIRLAANKFKFNNLTRHEFGPYSVDSIYHHMDKKVASIIRKEFKNSIDAVYAYEDAAYHSFKEAKNHGVKCIYDLPIAYWETAKNLLKEEYERLPNWAETIKAGLSDSEQKLIRKEDELKLADTIIVPSNFVKNSLPDWSNKKKIIMAPFGSPISSSFIKAHSTIKKPLRILFVGSMTQRKGLGDLFEAINIVNSSEVELIVLGSMQSSYEFYKGNIKRGFTYEKGRPHHEVLELMRSCDVFCLPSIVEGRALVMQEAMSQGLPLIITPNTGGEDLIINGETGFLVPIRSPEMIAEKINWFLDNRSQITDMGRLAQEHAVTYTWEKYSDNIINHLRNL